MKPCIFTSFIFLSLKLRVEIEDTNTNSHSHIVSIELQSYNKWQIWVFLHAVA